MFITGFSLYILQAFSKDELFSIKLASNSEWIDGFITKALKHVNRNPAASTRYYVVLDGQMDPSWIDDFYTLVDDKKLITLPNSETIHLNANVAVLFEVTCLLMYSRERTYGNALTIANIC